MISKSRIRAASIIVTAIVMVAVAWGIGMLVGWLFGEPAIGVITSTALGMCVGNWAVMEWWYGKGI